MGSILFTNAWCACVTIYGSGGSNVFVRCSDIMMIIQWASYQISKIASCACAGNAGNVFPRGQLQRKPLVSHPGMHHGTCVTHVPWCMSGSRTRGGGENVPDILGACASAILRIWRKRPIGMVMMIWLWHNAWHLYDWVPLCPLYHHISYRTAMRKIKCISDLKLKIETS